MDTCEEKDMNEEFSISGKKVTVFKADSPCASAVYLNSYDDEEGEKVWQELKNSRVDVNLIVISSLDWNCDMSPYSAPSVFRHAPDFSHLLSSAMLLISLAVRLSILICLRKRSFLPQKKLPDL